jgi:D-tyrosyl-tRNA(Tyr) deacylase
MRVLVQRVEEASVTVAGEQVAAIGVGLAVFVGIGRDDNSEDATYIVQKVAGLRVFPDADGRFNRSAQDAGAELLLVSQFTLYGDTRRGRRPSFTGAAPLEVAAEQFGQVVDRFRATGLPVAMGRFQEMMRVSLVNNGPVTIWIDSADRHQPRG